MMMMMMMMSSCVTVCRIWTLLTLRDISFSNNVTFISAVYLLFIFHPSIYPSPSLSLSLLSYRMSIISSFNDDHDLLLPLPFLSQAVSDRWYISDDVDEVSRFIHHHHDHHRYHIYHRHLHHIHQHYQHQ